VQILSVSLANSNTSLTKTKFYLQELPHWNPLYEVFKGSLLEEGERCSNNIVSIEIILGMGK
jgi:hypothetical protein